VSKYSESNPVVRLQVDSRNVGRRLDQFLSACNDGSLENISRAMFQKMIQQHHVLVDDSPQKAGYRLRLNEKIAVNVPPPESVNLVTRKN